MTPPDFGADVDRMTAYCTYCPKMCRFSCPAAAAESRETVTPWGMMRLFEMAKDESVALDADVADAFFHCTGCRRCKSWCKHENDVPRALWKARRWVVDSGFLPEAYVELDVQFDKTGTPWDVPADSIDSAPFDEEASVAFWPDCSTVQDQPELVSAIGRLFRRLGIGSVRLIRSEDFDAPPCCGFPLTGAGIKTPDDCRDDLWPALRGVDRIVTDCPGLAAWESPESSWSLSPGADTPEIEHVFDVLARRVPDVEPDEPVEANDAILHQSCYVTRQLKAAERVDEILAHICETRPEKMAYSGDESPCCGGRCHYRVLEPKASKRAAERVVESIDRHDGADRMVTTSSMCRRAMGEVSEGEVVGSVMEMVCEAYNCG